MDTEFAKFKCRQYDKSSPSLLDSYVYELNLIMQTPSWLKMDARKTNIVTQNNFNIDFLSQRSRD